MNRKHVFFWRLLVPLVRIFLWFRFGYTAKKVKNVPGPYIVLCNHVTDWDPLFLGSAFRDQMYFVASEHIARWPVAYKFLRFAFAPIMRYKGTVAASTVVEVLRKIKAGCSVAIFAEGVRCWDGVTGPILPSTGKLIKSARCGLVTYRICGGYFVSPNWTEGNLRRGPVWGSPVGVYTKEELASMSVDEINQLINRDLYENAYERQLEDPQVYKCKALSKGFENLMYLCPSCGKMDTIVSEDNEIRCTACGHHFHYTDKGLLEGTKFVTAREVLRWQKLKTRNLAEDGQGCSAPSGRLLTVDNHEETQVAEGPVTLSWDGICCGETRIPLDSISELTMHGRHALVFQSGRTYYELLIAPGCNALKFQIFYEAYRKVEADRARLAAAAK